MADTNADGRLFELYRSYLGEPDREVDVYLGFLLFFGAVGLGVGALGAGAVGQFVALEDYLSREVGFALGMVALPTVLLSLIVLLPVDRRGTYGGAVGALLCGAGVAAFTYAYPYSWAEGPGPRYAVPVLLVYGAGLVALLASTSAALVAYHIDRTRPSPADFEPEDDAEEETVSEERVRRDIDEAMEEVEISWGGIEPDDGTALELTTESLDVDASGMDVEVDRVRSAGVDDQVAGLRAVKGGELKTTRSGATVDDQTDRLRRLRERRREESTGGDEETVLGSLLVRLAGLVGRS